MKSRVELASPCGIDCWNCLIYVDNATPQVIEYFSQEYKKSPDDVVCHGCNSEHNGCIVLHGPCKILECLEEKNAKFCFECDTFPCDRLLPLAEHADKRYQNLKLYNLCRMKQVGVENWAHNEADLIRQKYFKGKFVAGDSPIL